MEVTILIPRTSEETFRECVCKFDSMAIAETVQRNEWIVFVLEDTEETDHFADDLFELGRLFEMMENLPY